MFSGHWLSRHCPDFLDILHEDRLRKCWFFHTTEKAHGHPPGTCKWLTRRKEMKPEHFQCTKCQYKGLWIHSSLWTSGIAFFTMKLVKRKPGLLRDAVGLLQRNAKYNWTWATWSCWFFLSKTVGLTDCKNLCQYQKFWGHTNFKAESQCSTNP